MKSMQEEGIRLVQEAESIFRRDVQGAWKDRDFNLVVRRAQEAVEIALKGALKIMGVDYPKVHDVAQLFTEQLRQKRKVQDMKALQRIEEISLWLAQSRTPSFYFEHEYGTEDAEKALEDSAFVLTEMKKLLNIS
jgi:HEPN domain-containing protein